MTTWATRRVPGHAIESMWSMERVYRGHPRRSERLRAALDVIRWSLERGWDAELGGLFLSCHLTGGTARWHRSTPRYSGRTPRRS